VALCLLCATGCGKKSPPPAKGPAQTKAPAPAQAQEPTKTPADYKAQADKEINQDNANQELDKLQKSIDQESAQEQ